MLKKTIFEKSLFFHKVAAKKYGYHLSIQKKDSSFTDQHKTPHEIIKNAIFSIKDGALSNDLPFVEKITCKNDYEKIRSEYESIFLRDSAVERLLSTAFNMKCEQLYSYSGFCDICNEEVTFLLDPVWTTHTEGLSCQKCNTVSRSRNLYHTILHEYTPGMNVYISEQVTPFFSYLKRIIPNLVGSEFVSCDMKDIRQNIRHEDATNLTFADNSFDLYISNDVFEHVFDYSKAFSEAFRILNKSGILLFHVPFYFKDKTSVRAKFTEDGALVHLEDPVYHGNPVSEKGALWVNDFGWDIFDTIKATGFTEAYALLKNDVKRGFLNNSALVFVAKKQLKTSSKSKYSR